MAATDDEQGGWILCNGQAVSRTTYAPLFAKIGTTHGGGDLSTTFNVPNFNGGSFPRGSITAGAVEPGDVGGDDAVALTIENLPPGSITSNTLAGPAQLIATGSDYFYAEAEGGVPVDIVPPFIGVVFFIKA